MPNALLMVVLPIFLIPMLARGTVMFRRRTALKEEKRGARN